MSLIDYAKTSSHKKYWRRRGALPPLLLRFCGAMKAPVYSYNIFDFLTSIQTSYVTVILCL